MKKIISIIISAVMLFTLCSCAKENQPVQEQGKDEISWGMNFKETRSVMEENLKIPFAESAHYVDGCKFRVFSAENFNDLGEAELLFHHGDEDALDAMYIDLKNTDEKDDFLKFLTDEFGEYTSTESQPFERLDIDVTRQAKDFYIWDNDNFYGVLIVTMVSDTQEIDSVHFTAATNKETHEKYWN